MESDVLWPIRDFRTALGRPCKLNINFDILLSELPDAKVSNLAT